MRLTAQDLLVEITPARQRALAEESLPSPGRTISRRHTILIERVTGHIFAPGELDRIALDSPHLQENVESLVVVQRQLPEALIPIEEVVDQLMDWSD